MIIKPPFKLFNQDFSGEVKELVLAYPRGIQYSGLTLNRLYEFYREYLQLIPNYITIIWIIKENKIKKELEKLKKEGQQFIYLVFKDLSDIWCGDWIPWITQDQNGNYLSVQFKYKESKEDELAGKYFNKYYLGYKLLEMPFYLDGGAIEYNEDEFIIISDKIFRDNLEYSQEFIEQKLKNTFKISDIFYLPSKSVLGHVDIFIKNIKKDLFFISDFGNQEENQVLEKLVMNIKIKYPNCKFIKILNQKPQHLDREGIDEYDYKGEESYYGNLFNFVCVGKTIIFPIF